jgi:hypothetical protein
MATPGKLALIESQSAIFSTVWASYSVSSGIVELSRNRGELRDQVAVIKTCNKAYAQEEAKVIFKNDFRSLK